MSAQELYDAYQAEVKAKGEWSEEAHKAWEKWAMVEGKLKTAMPADVK